MKPNNAPAPNRRPHFPLGGLGGFGYRICASPTSSAPVGEAGVGAFNMAHVQKSVVGLRIGGEALVPNEITKLLGASPTAAQIKGEKIVGRKTGHVRIAKMGMWRLHAKDREPEDMDGQVQEILGQLTSDLTIWKIIGEKYQVDLFCGIFLGGSNEGMTISAHSLAALGERGIEVGLDIYSGHDKDEPDT